MSEHNGITELPRNATLDDLVTVLKDQHGRKLDVVARAPALAVLNGDLHINGVEPVLSDDGVTMADGIYRPTRIADDGFASRFDIPPSYLARTRASNPDLFDTNLNSWLRHDLYKDKHFLARTFRGRDGGVGVLRAFLSNVYKPIENLDTLLAALEGIEQAGVEVNITGCDLTEQRMYVRVEAPQVQVLAPVLGANYRSVFSQGVQRAGWTLDRARAAAAREGQAFEPGTEPIVSAGFVISNSEVGKGRFQLDPRMVFQPCKNGLQIEAGLKSQHLGAPLDEGIIRWSDTTNEKALALITAQAADAVRTYLDVEYMTRKVAEIEALAGKPVQDAEKTVEVVSKKLRYSEARRAEILSHFIKGGQMTAGGVLNAVTSVAQTLADADEAAKLETDAPRAMALAAQI